VLYRAAPSAGFSDNLKFVFIEDMARPGSCQKLNVDAAGLIHRCQVPHMANVFNCRLLEPANSIDDPEPANRTGQLVRDGQVLIEPVAQFLDAIVITLGDKAIILIEAEGSEQTASNPGLGMDYRCYKSDEHTDTTTCAGDSSIPRVSSVNRSCRRIGGGINLEIDRCGCATRPNQRLDVYVGHSIETRRSLVVETIYDHARPGHGHLIAAYE
jgi:hypothetical protein